MSGENKEIPLHLQEVVFGSSEAKTSKQLTKLASAGKLRKLAPRLYSGNLTDSPEEIVRRNLFTILGRLYPGAVLSHRSALEFRPTTSGHIFLTYTYTKKAKLPGVVLRFLEGPGPVEGDNLLSGELYVSQLERALLENLQVTRQSGPESKVVSLPYLEERLEQVARVKGERALNELRDNARTLAASLGMEAEYRKLDAIIGALLSSRPAHVLKSSLAAARALGHPYDPQRTALFETLFIALQQQQFPDRPDRNMQPQPFRNIAFFEAYFSNYIEGTVFEIDEARQIIETQSPLPARNADSHDILGTYLLVSRKQEMETVPESFEAFADILLYRHRVLMSARPGSLPGTFKDKNNRAGNTYFVDHTLVKGTLGKGFEFYRGIHYPFAKAAFMMFLVSEVHPFIDGNGRIARIMMNAELVHSGQCRIVIPTVFRDDYLLTLRKLSRQQDPEPYIKMMLQAWAFSDTFPGADLEVLQRHLEGCHAFDEPGTSRLTF